MKDHHKCHWVEKDEKNNYWIKWFSLEKIGVNGIFRSELENELFALRKINDEGIAKCQKLVNIVAGIGVIGIKT